MTLIGDSLGTAIHVFSGPVLESQPSQTLVRAALGSSRVLMFILFVSSLRFVVCVASGGVVVPIQINDLFEI